MDTMLAPVGDDLGALAYSLTVKGFRSTTARPDVMVYATVTHGVYVYTDPPGGGVLVICQRVYTGLNEWRVMFDAAAPLDAVTAFILAARGAD